MSPGPQMTTDASSASANSPPSVPKPIDVAGPASAIRSTTRSHGSSRPCPQRRVSSDLGELDRSAVVGKQRARSRSTTSQNGCSRVSGSWSTVWRTSKVNVQCWAITLSADAAGDRAAVERHLGLADRAMVAAGVRRCTLASLTAAGDRARLAVRQAGVRRFGTADDLVRQLAHVAVTRSHHRRLADRPPGRGECRRRSRDHGERIANADAADLLVERQCDVQRPRQLDIAELRGHADHRGDEALHVGGAATVQRSRRPWSSSTDRWPIPSPAGTTSVCPDSISPPVACGPNEASRLARPSAPSSTVARPPFDSRWSATQRIRSRFGVVLSVGKATSCDNRSSQFDARVVGDCGCWHGLTV